MRVIHFHLLTFPARKYRVAVNLKTARRALCFSLVRAKHSRRKMECDKCWRRKFDQNRNKTPVLRSRSHRYYREIFARSERPKCKCVRLYRRRSNKRTLLLPECHREYRFSRAYCEEIRQLRE